MNQFVFFLEERSARELLQGLLPRVIPGGDFRFIVFEGKSDLKKRLPRRLRILHKIREQNTHFVVMLDQDSSDCERLKSSIRTVCDSVGCPDVLTRIICRELESWYLADLQAVEQGLGIGNLAKHQNKRIYRNPDVQHNPDEVLKKLTKGSYKKMMGSRQIGLYLDPGNTRSPSFKNFIVGIRRIAGI